MSGRCLVFIATSLDGFIAGPDDDLSFLEPQGEMEDTFTPFFADVGVLLMGRRTFDTVSAMPVDWPYGETSVHVLTHRPIEPAAASVRGVSGDIRSVIADAKAEAGDKHVYIDGGNIIRQALDAGLVDEIIVSVVPTILGDGTPLFAGVSKRHELELLGQRAIGAGFVEVRYRPMRT